MMTNRSNGVLYVGVTTNLARRVWEHREGVVKGFTTRYGRNRLVYFEYHQTLLLAKQRESNLKHWPRGWKVRLILKENLDWDDLYHHLI
ncbi:MAG TPA: GIY-YIG nuclease family protein [Stellaceae bacterium]|jgi:putative endonuclease